MRTSLFSSGPDSLLRERRLCHQQSPFEPDRSPVENWINQGNEFLENGFERVTQPGRSAMRRQEEQRADQIAQGDAFRNQDAFTGRQNPRALRGSGNVNTNELLSMPPEQRLGRLQEFISRVVPQQIQMRYPDLFATPLDMNDVADMQQGGGRMLVMQNIIGIVNGQLNQQSSDPYSWQIAQEVMQSRSGPELMNSPLYGAFSKWMRETTPTPSEAQATNPQFIMASRFAQPELAASIQTGECDTQTLKHMFEIFTNYRTDTRLSGLDQRHEYMKMHGSMYQREYEQKSSNMVDNFKSMPQWQQWTIIGVGLFAIYKGMKSENKAIKGLTVGATALIGGYYLYDRVINGNQNAINDMGSKFKNGVNFTTDKIRQVGQYAGIMTPKERDHLAAFQRFLDVNKLGIAPASSGMAAMATVPFGTILNAFNPNEGAVIGGNLSIEEMGASFGSGGGNDDPAGRQLYSAIIDQANRQGLSAQEKRYMIQYLQSNKESMGKAIAHVLFMIAAQELQNIGTLREIERTMEEMGAAGNYDMLPLNLRAKYQAMVIQGMTIARSGKYAGKSFVDILPSLGSPQTTPRRRPGETASRINDPETPTRSEEFALYREVRAVNLEDKASYTALIAETGPVKNDYLQFVANAVGSGMIEEGASRELTRRFDKLLENAGRGESLSETLLLVEKLKYAVMVTVAKAKKPLTEDMVVQMAGPASGTRESTFGAVKSFLSPSNFGAFLNRIAGVGVPSGFTNVSSLSNIRGMLVEPWFGSGPLASSSGQGFNRLRTKVDTYKQRFERMKNYDNLAETFVDQLSARNPDIIARLQGRDKAKEVIARLVKTREYENRVNRAEEFLSQKLANSLVTAQILRHGPEGFNDFEGGRAISDNEIANLERDFDRLFAEIVGDIDQTQPGMWAMVEDIKVMFETLDVDTFEFGNNANRVRATSHVIDIGNAFMLRLVPRPQINDLERNVMRRRVEQIKEKMVEQLKKDMQAENVSADNLNANNVFEFLDSARNWTGAKAIALKNEYQPKLQTIKDVLTLLEADITDDLGLPQPNAPTQPAGPVEPPNVPTTPITPPDVAPVVPTPLAPEPAPQPLAPEPPSVLPAVPTTPLAPEPSTLLAPPPAVQPLAPEPVGSVAPAPVTPLAPAPSGSPLAPAPSAPVAPAPGPSGAPLAPPPSVPLAPAPPTTRPGGLPTAPGGTIPD